MWMRMKAALPGNPNEMKSARVLAESLLVSAHPRSADDANLLASIAALIGDADHAASLAARGADLSDFPLPVPRDVFGSAAAFLAYASLGEPVDSLIALESRLRMGIKNGVVPDRQLEVASNLVGHAATIAFPVHRFESLAMLDSAADYLVAMERQFAGRRWRDVRKALKELERSRAALRPADIAFEAVYPEAWLALSIGDTAWAVSHVAETLDAVRSIPSSKLGEVANAGSIVQAMLIRAELAYAQHDYVTANLWAHAVQTLSDTTKRHGKVRTVRTQRMLQRR
jgi:hypothetical protein